MKIQVRIQAGDQVVGAHNRRCTVTKVAGDRGTQIWGVWRAEDGYSIGLTWQHRDYCTLIPETFDLQDIS